MTKNKLELKFRESVNCYPDVWCLKLQVSTFSHKSTPADYILSIGKGEFHYTCLLECKLVTVKNGKGRFDLKRLTQLNSIDEFIKVNPKHHLGFFLIAFFNKRWKDSKILLFPIGPLMNMIKQGKKSLSFEEVLGHYTYERYELGYEDNHILLPFITI